jgi:PAS domain S-box-containing protein
MPLHPGARERHFPEEAPVAWDPIRRDLQQNVDWYRDLVEHSQDLLSVHDLEGRLLSINPVPARLLGYSVEEMLRKRLRDFVDPRYLAEYDAYLHEIKHKGESHGLVAVMTRSGEQRIWEYHNTLRTEGVAVPIVRGIAHDVTERVRAEKALRRMNAALVDTTLRQEGLLHGLTLFRTLLDQSNDAVEVVDPTTMRFLDVNEKACIELGYTREELLSMTVFDIDPQIDRASPLGRCSGESGFGIKEGIHRRKDGTTFPVEVSSRRVLLDREYVVAVSRDITARKRAEEALRATGEELLKTSQERERILRELTLFRALLDQSSDAIEVIDPETGRFLDVNQTACTHLGYSREELLSMTVFDIDPTYNASMQAGVTQRFRDSGFAILESSNRRKDGTTFPVEVSVRRVRLDRDYRIAVARDISARKRGEERLQEFERVVENLEEMIVVVDREYRYVLANRAFLNKRGMTKEQIIGRTSAEILNPGVFETVVKEKLDECFRGNVVAYDLKYQYADIGERDLSMTYLPVEGPSGVDRVACVVRDVTERKHAENALRKSEMRFRTVYERSPLGISLVDSLTGRFLQVNPKFCEITGRSEEELLQSDVRSITHPDDVERDVENLRQLAEEKLTSYEMEKRYFRPDGSVRWVRLFVTPMWSKGDTQRWEMGLMEDITERKQTEGAIATLVQQVQADSSEHFFTSLAIHLAKCLEADYTIIGEIVEGEAGKARTLGVCGQGVIAANFDRELADTPCGALVEHGACSYVSGVTETFPKDTLLKQMKVEGYTGTPLRDSQGRTVGLMVALYTRPLPNPGFAEMILQLFSTRTASEIERKRTEEALRQSDARFRVAIKNSPIAVFNQDRDLRYTWVYNSQLPMPGSDKVGKTMSELFDPGEVARIAEVRRQVIETGVGVRHEAQLTSNGKKRYLDTTIEPVFNASGAVIGLTGAAMDITELRETSDALREAKKKLTEEKLYLEQEINTELGFGEIIGQSKALQSVMEHVSKVASSDATVLLLGETGTGKELVARALHRLSQRANNSFIKMNCAAIPSGLLESELFGNEKGAFTGAVSKKLGRLELADRGTLFLDEIGEISLALQPKLLRVLQDQEFERLGGTQTLKVDFRLIAATNRDLADSVRENEFRSDLYYRLNVFPIRVPPLRERREDIRLLVEYFVQKCARRMNKSISSIPKKTMDALMEWEWPGNVRELENFVERSVILTQGSVLVSPLSEMTVPTVEQDKADETLESAEREHILRALRESHGQIGGLRGAAMRLGLKRTTLQSKLKHLGIDPRSTKR